MIDQMYSSLQVYEQLLQVEFQDSFDEELEMELDDVCMDGLIVCAEGDVLLQLGDLLWCIYFLSCCVCRVVEELVIQLAFFDCVYLVGMMWFGMGFLVLREVIVVMLIGECSFMVVGFSWVQGWCVLLGTIVLFIVDFFFELKVQVVVCVLGRVG